MEQITTYQHLQAEDRMTMASLRQQGSSMRAMARMLGRSASTISREFRRNTLAALPYASHSAQLSCDARRQAARPAAKLDMHGVGWSVVLTLLDWKWSPQQIAATLKRVFPDEPERHEYLDGQVLTRDEADDAHVTIAGNVAMALRQYLSGSRCRTYMSDMRLHVTAANAYFYPDVMVTCSDADRASPLVKREPVLLVEVLSLSTAAYDRSAKFGHYRRLPGLREFALVDSEARTADVYRLGDDGLWVLHPSARGEAVALASVGLTLDAERLYADVLDD